jgi:Putative serine dehydratase domain
VVVQPPRSPAAISTATAPRRSLSSPAQDRAIVDAGLKALAFDSGPPACDEPAATYERASDEHGRLGISGATNRLNIGDKVRLIPGHCDPTVTPTLPSPASGGGLGRGALVCRRPRRPRRAALPDHRPRRGLLTFIT